MTVTYTSKVATCRGLSSFLKLLARWRGSIYKLIWLDFTLFLFLYYVLNFTYRFKLDGEQKIIFENISKYCKQCSSYIPLSFVLGFYVSIVMARWWQQYISIPFPDSIAVLVSATLHGQDERARVMRRTILRYVCLCVTMLFTNISTKVKLRFPTLDHFVEAGLMLPSEKDVITGLNKKFPKYSKHWLPLVWAASIVTRARQEGRIRDDFTVKSLLDELNKFRGKCGVLITYDRISIPLVYTQVVTLAVYSFFLIVLMGDQWLEDHQKEYKFDLYFPIFTMLQFFFYTGWLKVAESLINPFGDDDDDFELNWMVDRNLQISYLIVDEMHQEHPELIKDQYWEKVLPETLPYTAESEPFREQHPLPSTANIAGNFYEDDAANDMMSSPISFSAKSGSLRNRSGSQHSFTNSRISMITKANSLSSMVRRLLSRENSRTDSRADVRDSEELGELKSKIPKKLIEQIIEEVDEQLTMTKVLDETKRPNLLEVFEQSSPTEPIPIPSARPLSGEYSAMSSPRSPFPDGQDYVGDPFNFSSSDEDLSVFDQLKVKRDQERLLRIKENLTKYMNKHHKNDDQDDQDTYINKHLQE